MLSTMLMLLAMVAPPADNATTNPYVTVAISLADTVVAKGGSGNIVVTFATVEGIHITSDPSVEFHLKKNTRIALKGEPEFETDKSGYVASAEPVRQWFTVSAQAKPGVHAITGTLVYYFCSDAEGWCRKFTQPIALTLNVQKK